MALHDPAIEAFGQSGLAARMKDVTVRILVLPRDPFADIVTFDEDLWGWWLADRDNPFTGAARTGWGAQHAPTAHAAARFDRYNGTWEHYLAIHRTGAIEHGMGRDGGGSWRTKESEERSFNLVTIVGRIWNVLTLAIEASSRYELTGPWEVSVSLINTSGALMGNVALGWKDLNDWWAGDRPPRCKELNLLLRLEVTEWPDPDGVKDLAFKLGGMIEDAWETKNRRFLVNAGREGAGEFDPSRYTA